jgi:hypothetical protein
MAMVAAATTSLPERADDFPQAFVHALLLEAAFTLDRCDADRPGARLT